MRAFTDFAMSTSMFTIDVYPWQWYCAKDQQNSDLVFCENYNWNIFLITEKEKKNSFRLFTLRTWHQTTKHSLYPHKVFVKHVHKCFGLIHIIWIYRRQNSQVTDAEAKREKKWSGKDRSTIKIGMRSGPKSVFRCAKNWHHRRR